MRPPDRAQSRIPQPWRGIVDWLVTITFAVVFVLAFQAEVAKPYRIPSSSMEPTLHCAKPGAWCLGSRDDRVIANRLAYRFGNPQRRQIRGLPGEQVTEGRGKIYINGRRLAEPYVNPAFRSTESGSWPHIGSDDYFFLGDNRIHSGDSRTWGTVPRKNLIGQ